MNARRRGALVSGLLALAAVAALVLVGDRLKGRGAAESVPAIPFPSALPAQAAEPAGPDLAKIESELRAALAEGDGDEAARLLALLKKEGAGKVPEQALRLLERAVEEGTALRRGESPYAVVSFDGVQGDELGAEALALVDDAIWELSAALGFSPERKLEVVVYSDPRFSNGAGIELPNWVEAAYDGKLRLPAELVFDEARRASVVRHETAHAFVHLMAGDAVPLWMDEGIAQHLEGRPMPECWSRSWDFPPLDRLKSPFVGESDPMRAFVLYASSLALVEHLVALKEWSSVRAYLNEIRQGKPEEVAFAEAFELTADKAWADAQIALAARFCSEPDAPPAEEPAAPEAAPEEAPSEPEPAPDDDYVDPRLTEETPEIALWPDEPPPEEPAGEEAAPAEADDAPAESESF